MKEFSFSSVLYSEKAPALLPPHCLRGFHHFIAHSAAATIKWPVSQIQGNMGMAMRGQVPRLILCVSLTPSIVAGLPNSEQ
jgi:hypothetical protein